MLEGGASRAFGFPVRANGGRLLYRRWAKMACGGIGYKNGRRWHCKPSSATCKLSWLQIVRRGCYTKAGTKNWPLLPFATTAHAKICGRLYQKDYFKN